MPIQQQESSRLRWITFDPTTQPRDEGAELIAGLARSPKTLPCRYFYDDYGSDLFEQICNQPEYYPTRTEQAILERYAGEIAALTGVCELVELGSGSSRKTHLLLEAYGALTEALQYCPIDVSAGMLRMTALNLLEQYPQLRLCGLAGTYEQALAGLPPRSRDNRLVIFLGSSIGNFEPVGCDRFLGQIQRALQPGEFFLLGVDLQKDPAIIEAAYNDAQGVTAEFNRNMLRHLNRRFQGDFDLSQFAHWAFYNRDAHQIEMHLRSLAPQRVTLAALDYTVELKPGETLHTEISRKFYLPSLVQDLRAHHLEPLQVWTDPNQWFALILSQRQCQNAIECP